MKKVSKILGLTVASINGMLDGYELNNDIEVIPKSEVIADLKSLLMRINEAQNEVNKITFNPSVSGSLPLVDFEAVQSELNKSFDNIRMGAEHTLYLNEKFEVRKRQ